MRHAQADKIAVELSEETKRKTYLFISLTFTDITDYGLFC